MNRRSIAQRQRRERERQERELQEFSNRRQDSESAQQITPARSSINQGLHHEAHMAARYASPPTTGNGVATPVRPSVPALPVQHDQGKLILAYNVAFFNLVCPASQPPAENIQSLLLRRIERRPQLPTPPPTNMIGMTLFFSIYILVIVSL